jgi:hypothetical protein
VITLVTFLNAAPIFGDPPKRGKLENQVFSVCRFTDVGNAAVEQTRQAFDRCYRSVAMLISHPGFE